jgi:hypothetical protein
MWVKHIALLMAFLMFSCVSAESNETVEDVPAVLSMSQVSTSTTSSSSVYDDVVDEWLEYDVVATTTTFGGRRGDYQVQTPIPSDSGRTCGGSSIMCLVEYDINGDGIMECCDEGNNIMCEKCLEECKISCWKKGRGVERCFMGVDGNPVCECSNSLPTCYVLRIDRPALNTSVGEGVEEARLGGSNMLYYFIVFIIGLAVFISAVGFINRVG